MKRSKIYQFYYLLASLGLLTILLTVGIASGIHQVYEQSFENNDQWIKRIELYEETSKLIVKASSPGNNVFDGQDLRVQKIEFNKILALLNSNIDRIEDDVKKNIEDSEYITKELEKVRKTILKGEHNTYQVFTNFQSGNMESAARFIPIMDTHFHSALTTMAELKRHLRSSQRKDLIRNHDKATSLFKKEIYVGVIIFVIIGLVLFYGRKLRENIEASEDEVFSRNRELLSYELALNEHSIVAKTDPDGIITYVNDRFCNVSQFSREELIGQNHNILNSDFHPTSFFKELWEKINSGKKWRGQIKNKKKNGDLYWVDTSITPLKDSHGNIIEFLAIRTEITEQKNLEREIIDAKEYLDLALEGAGLGIWDWDLRTNAVKFDHRWAEMLGLDINEIEMKLDTWESRVHPDDLDQCYSDIQSYMDGKTDSYNNVHRMKHVKGHWVHILDKGRFSDFDDQGKPTRFTGTHLDITDSVNSQEERLKEVDRIISSTPSCLKIITKDGQLVDMNSQGLDLIEAPNIESVKGANVYEIVEESHRDKFIAFNEKICSGESDTLIFEIIGLRGTRRWMETYAAPYKLPNGDTAHVAITNEITARVQAQRELEDQKKLAQHHAKLASIGELAAGVGHEINNPLAIIKGYLSVMEKKLQDKKDNIDFDQCQSYLEKIDIASDRINRIVQGLRTFSRSDSGDIEYFNPISAIQESVNMLDEIYQKEGIQLEYLNHVQEESSIYGNRGKFQQVMMNLISNAKDAISQQSEKKISIIAQNKGRKLFLKVTDTGTGIPQEIQDKIFDPFFTTKEVNEGTGIGLSLVHNFVEELNGSIRIESSSSNGTCFSLELPLSESSEKLTEIESKQQTQSTKLQGRVLLVDDEEGIRDILQDILEDLGMDVITATNGQEAFQTYTQKADELELIISDMKMPLMDGPTLLRTIRESSQLKQPKFIFITGGINIDFESPDNEFESMLDGYILKPFTEEKILEVISHVLNDRKVA